jgi:hypothetical protein
MTLWIIAALLFLFSVHQGLPLLLPRLLEFRQTPTQTWAPAIRNGLQWIESIADPLQCGRIPNPESWNQLKRWSEKASNGEKQRPELQLFASLLHHAIHELREQGGSVLPTLERMRRQLSQQLESLLQAESKSGGVRGQALVCAGISLGIWMGAPGLLPEIKRFQGIWTTLSFFTLLMVFCGGYWITKIGESASWAALPRSRRHWIFVAPLLGETFLAKLHAGNSPDSAWLGCLEFGHRFAPELTHAWSGSVWETRENSPAQNSHSKKRDCESLLIELGTLLKRSAHLAILEGQPCSAKISDALDLARFETQACRDAELEKVPHRALQPLLFLIAPALLIQIFSAIGLTFLSWMNEMGTG